MRTCHFVKNQNQKRTLYITLVKSLEQCGEIWAPNAVVAQNKFDPIQKRAVKWILGELNLKYNENEYISKLKLLDLLPLQYIFQLKELKLFHRIRNGTIAINMPPYVIQHRLAHSSSNNINKLAVSTKLTQPIIRPFGNRFFPSSIAVWNSIPSNIQNLDSQPESFRKTKEHFWSSILIAHNLEPD